MPSTRGSTFTSRQASTSSSSTSLATNSSTCWSGWPPRCCRGSRARCPIPSRRPRLLQVVLGPLPGRRVDLRGAFAGAGADGGEKDTASGNSPRGRRPGRVRRMPPPGRRVRPGRRRSLPSGSRPPPPRRTHSRLATGSARRTWSGPELAVERPSDAATLSSVGYDPAASFSGIGSSSWWT